MLYLKSYHKKVNHILLIPFIFSVIIPLVIMDFWIEMYHRVCFWLCKMSYVKRNNYIRIDRHKLQYLNWHDKLSCAYCGYANGLAAYWVKIAGDTERYWCGIKHKTNSGFVEPEHHKNFAKYGDEKEFREKYKN